MKTTYLIAGAVGVLLLIRAKRREEKSTQLADSVPRSGSDFITDAWTQLNGGGMTAPGYPNIAPGANADPGKVGALSVLGAAMWDGSMTTAA